MSALIEQNKLVSDNRRTSVNESEGKNEAEDFIENVDLKSAESIEENKLRKQ